MIDVSFDTRKFNKELNELAGLTQISNSAIVTRTAKLVVRDAYFLTPPTSRGTLSAKGSGNAKTQFNIGVKAINRDVNRAFRRIDNATEWVKSDRLGVALERVAARGNYKAAEKILKSMGVWFTGVVGFATKARHDTLRVKGTVSKKVRPFFVALGHSVQALIDSRIKDLGKAKSGWVRAMRKLGISVPKYVSRHGSPGTFVGIRDKEAPEISFSNDVSYIQDKGAEMQIMKQSFANRARNMELELTRLWKAAGSGGLAKLRDRWQREAKEALE